MSDDRDRGFTERVRRFFRFPRQAPRGTAPIRPLAWCWLFGAAWGTGAAALGWSDGVDLMVVVTVFALLDDVIKGVRHRWPAFAVGSLGGWAADRLVEGEVATSGDPGWAAYPGLAVGTLVAFAVFAAITRLPGPQRG
ncbi:hypothetical protein ABZT48_27295 [Streptomyces avermitilis]|uniref:hypothetical protein n=1 Tax=Streptomyces avermitilis TaxID=33903 RepID=UPI00339DEF51